MQQHRHCAHPSTATKDTSKHVHTATTIYRSHCSLASISSVHQPIATHLKIAILARYCGVATSKDVSFPTDHLQRTLHHAAYIAQLNLQPLQLCTIYRRHLHVRGQSFSPLFDHQQPFCILGLLETMCGSQANVKRYYYAFLLSMLQSHTPTGFRELRQVECGPSL